MINSKDFTMKTITTVELTKEQIASKRRSIEAWQESLIENVTYIADGNPYWRLVGIPKSMTVRIAEGSRGEKIFVLPHDCMYKIDMYKYYKDIQADDKLKPGMLITIEYIFRKALMNKHTEEEEAELRAKKPHSLFHYDRAQLGIIYSAAVWSLENYDNKFSAYERIPIRKVVLNSTKHVVAVIGVDDKFKNKVQLFDPKQINSITIVPTHEEFMTRYLNDNGRYINVETVERQAYYEDDKENYPNQVVLSKIISTPYDEK